jgi:hypothetical protein
MMAMHVYRFVYKQHTGSYDGGEVETLCKGPFLTVDDANASLNCTLIILQNQK